MTLAGLLAMMGLNQPDEARQMRLVWVGWWVAIAGLLVTPLVIGSLRLLNFWQQPLAGIGFFGALLCATLLVVVLRLFLLTAKTPSWFYWLPGLALLALAWSLSLPGLSTSSLLFTWGLVLASEGAWLGYRMGRDPSSAQSLPSLSEPTSPDIEEGSNEAALPDNLLQQQSRQIDSETGSETLQGHIRANFPPGEPLCVLHLAFCPPLAFVPELSAEIAGDLAAEITITKVHTFGARMEIRLPHKPTTAVTTLIEWFGMLPPAT